MYTKKRLVCQDLVVPSWTMGNTYPKGAFYVMGRLADSGNFFGSFSLSSSSVTYVTGIQMEANSVREQ